MAEETTATETEAEETATDTSTEETATDTKVTSEDDWKAKARKHEKASKSAVKELETARAELKRYQDRDKSETDRLNDKASEAEKRAEAAESKLLRVQVAASKKLPPELAERLQGSTEDELEADADRLLELVKTTDTKVVDTDAGKGTSSSGGTSFNDIIRGASARG